MGAVLNDFDDPAVRLHVDPNTIAGTMRLKTTLLLTSLSAAALGLRAADFDAAKLPPASTQAGVTYEKDIKPLFERSCFKCHGAEKQKGKLRLDSLEATLKGGSNGPGFEKGASAKSTFDVSARACSESIASANSALRSTDVSSNELGCDSALAARRWSSRI